MWVRKTSNELKNDKMQRNKSPVLPPIIGFICALVGLFYEPTLENFLALFFVVTIIAYLVQYLFSDALMGLLVLFGGSELAEPATDICNSCNEVKSRDRKKKCHCGGKFEAIEKWKWVD